MGVARIPLADREPLLHEPAFRTGPDGHYFCGYYDKPPTDRTGSRLLALRVDRIDRVPDSGDEAAIGHFDLRTGAFRALATTTAFNWQQGAMVQWLGPTHDREILFNRQGTDGFEAVVLDVESGVERSLDRAAYAVNESGTLALSVDFERHYWCRRGYSYGGIVRPEKNRDIVDGDGLWLTDVKTGTSRLVVDIGTLRSLQPLSSMEGATHYVEHASFGPDGDSFAFYHRWKLQTGGIYTRVFTSRVTDPKVHLVWDSGRASHMCWLDGERILIGGSRKSLAGAVRRSRMLSRMFSGNVARLYRNLIKGNAISGHSFLSRHVTGDSFYVIDAATGSAAEVFADELDRDGHPSAVPGRPGWVVTDTYPDDAGNALLLVGSPEQKRVQVLARLRSMREYDNTPLRCDLHPKVSRDGEFVCVDTMNDGRRGVYLYRMPWPRIQQ